MIYLWLLLYVFITPSVQIFEKHKKVTTDNITKKCQSNSSNVPEYEVVSVRHNFYNRRVDNMEIKVNINGTDTKIYLDSVDGLFFSKKTKIWTLKKDPININKMQYVLEENVMDKLNITFYQDNRTLSSIIRIANDEGKSTFQGVIDSDKVLQPLSNSYHYKKKCLLFKNKTKHFTNSEHMLYKTYLHKTSSKKVSKSDKEKINTDSKNESKKMVQSMRKSKLGIPDIVYPEIMIVLDKKLFSYFEYNVEKAVYYVLSYWNAVDLLFRRLEKPQVRLNIAGIILTQEKLPFIDKTLFIDDILLAFTHFLFDEDKIKFRKDYDAAMLMTGENIKKPDNNKIKGRAHVGATCWQNTSKKQVYATSVVTHKKLYNSIITTVHELAHLFGAFHDGSSAQTYVGGPGGNNCPSDDGYIMSHKRHNENQFMFSKCSIKSMSFFFNRKNADCLRNKPGVRSQ